MLHARKSTGRCLVVTLCAVSGTALADWKGKGEVGASFASGNSENESANGALEMKHTRDKWTNAFGFAGNYGSDGTAGRREDRYSRHRRIALRNQVSSQP